MQAFREILPERRAAADIVLGHFAARCTRPARARRQPTKVLLPEANANPSSYNFCRGSTATEAGQVFGNNGRGKPALLGTKNWKSTHSVQCFYVRVIVFGWMKAWRVYQSSVPKEEQSARWRGVNVCSRGPVPCRRQGHSLKRPIADPNVNARSSDRTTNSTSVRRPPRTLPVITFGCIGHLMQVLTYETSFVIYVCQSV
jgi:hypothetical protein